jgi:hypothetical protein
VIQPQHLGTVLPGCEPVRFPDEYFLNVDAYSRMLLSPFFYEAFSSFDYILIYQLDCLVFSDDLAYWCSLGLDYIGAPFFRKNVRRPRFSHVGNGGLSLRNVHAFSRALHSSRFMQTPVSLWAEFFRTRLPDLADVPFWRRWYKKMQILRQARRGVQWYANQYTLNEDRFWSDRARLFDPKFQIAPLAVGLSFAFEQNPRYCFERNDRRIPFGCHAWAKWDSAFWEPYILK